MNSFRPAAVAEQLSLSSRRCSGVQHRIFMSWAKLRGELFLRWHLPRGQSMCFRKFTRKHVRKTLHLVNKGGHEQWLRNIAKRFYRAPTAHSQTTFVFGNQFEVSLRVQVPARMFSKRGGSNFVLRITFPAVAPLAN